MFPCKLNTNWFKMPRFPKKLKNTIDAFVQDLHKCVQEEDAALSEQVVAEALVLLSPYQICRRDVLNAGNKFIVGHSHFKRLCKKDGGGVPMFSGSVQAIKQRLAAVNQTSVKLKERDFGAEQVLTFSGEEHVIGVEHEQLEQQSKVKKYQRGSVMEPQTLRAQRSLLKDYQWHVDHRFQSMRQKQLNQPPQQQQQQQLIQVPDDESSSDDDDHHDFDLQLSFDESSSDDSVEVPESIDSTLGPLPHI